jgi:hypothetical protein
MGQLFSAEDEALPQTMQRIALSRLTDLRIAANPITYSTGRHLWRQVTGRTVDQQNGFVSEMVLLMLQFKSSFLKLRSSAKKFARKIQRYHCPKISYALQIRYYILYC